ncbi:Ribosomal protein uS12 methylthiotransferase RimO [Trichinella pseudospiralis]
MSRRRRRKKKKKKKKKTKVYKKMKRSLDGMCLRSRLIDLPLLLLGEGTDCSGTSADGLVSEVARLDCDGLFLFLNGAVSL